MNLDSVEESIQSLLSALYPPYEATAPVLLSQLFQILDSHYQRDALRCFLDFLVPAKHILDTVQQAACAQYSNVLFLCEGWPLCLHDQVVVHLAPIDPLLLQPGDFYLQVAPFCHQSARVVVCSLLEEEGLSVQVAEETPIPETSYPCIFSQDWLNELNQDRCGTPLRQCLVATEQGLVRLPWEQVAVPDFVPQSVESSMASTPQSYPPLPPPLPVPPPLPEFTDNCPTNNYFPSSSKRTEREECPVTIENPALTSPSPSSAFSVETRICPAKHGIAVSLCLVDTRTASSTRLVKVKGTETEGKPVGWVSPNTWDSRFTGTHTATKSNGVSDKHIPSGLTECKVEKTGAIVSENSLLDKGKETKIHNMSKYELTANAVAQGEYIDILQAKMLFGKDQPLSGEQLNVLTQSHLQTEAQTQNKSYKTGQPATQIPLCTQSQPYVGLQTKSQSVSRSNMSKEAGLLSAHQHSQTQHLDSLEPPQCVRTLRFAEKPCTPCMVRRQGGQVARAQDLKCRYRDSYQAAIQNPVAFGTERTRGNMLAVVDEDGDLSQCVDKRGPLRTEIGDPRSDIQETSSETGIQLQSPSSVSEDIYKESVERNIGSQRKMEHVNPSSCMENRAINPLQFVGLHDSSEKTAGPCRNAHSAKSYGNLHNVNLNPSSEPRMNTTNVLSGTNGPKHSSVSIKHHGLPFSSNEMSCENLQNTTSPTAKSLTAPQNRQDSLSSKRCSSLSTAVVDTSEKCELVIVEGQNVRRKENTHTSAEIPQLHVVKCKNSTAFGLVSPKINRRKKVIPAGEQPGPTSVTSGNDHQTEKLSPTISSTKAETQRVRQPRPHHLPLGSPDPKEHPLYLGAASLTGCKDRMGRAIVELHGDHHGWRSTVTSQELFQMLLYFYSITRKEIREAGMTLIFDARRKNPQPQLYKALMTLQEQCPCAVSSFVLLVDKDNRQPERCPGIQTDLVTSIKALLKLVEVSQLSSGVGGSSDGRCGWMELHQRLFPFVIDLHEALCLLLRAISKLEEPQMTDTVQAVQQRMMDQKTLMRDMLEDSRLVKLQREGGAILARLRKESDLKYPHCEDLSDAVDSVSSLYNQVEEQAHVLVQKTNVSLEHLEYLLQLREMEGLFYQIQQWYNAEGERHLLEAASIQSSGDRMEQVLNSFTGFLIEANDRRHHAMSLVSEADRIQQSGLSYPETEAFRAFVCTFKSSLEDFLCRAEARGRELQIMVNVCDFCEQATELAGECTDFLTQSRSRIHTIQDLQCASQANQTNTWLEQQNKDPCPSSTPLCQSDATHSSGPTASTSPSSDRIILQSFQEKFLHFSPDKFQETKALASTLPDSRGIQVWDAAYLKYQEAQELLQERMQVLDDVCHQQAVSSSCCEGHYVDVISTNVQTASPGGQMLVVQSTHGFQHPQWEEVVSGAADVGKRRPILDSKTPHSTAVACCNIIIKPEDSSDAGASQESKVTPHSPHRSARKTDREARRRQTSRARSERDAAALSQSHTVGCQWFPWKRGPGVRSVSQDSCTPRVATASSSPEQQPRPPSSCSHHSQPSSRILQEAQKFQISRHGSFCSEEESCMSNRGAVGGIGTVCCKHSSLPTGQYGGAFNLSSSPENTNSALRLQRIMEELVLTEREYVRSLGYILSHYLPLMDRLDIPQDLRGKRGVIFGNLEKLYDFHSHYFLLELEACERQPGMVARCFLRHSGSFGLYSLYSKNKPQSDALILHHRHDIFKKKQHELGDMMDLSSYLLRPIQRISKYSLLLQDMLALVSSRTSRERTHDTMSPFGVCGHGACDLSAHAPDLTDFERDRERADIQAAADLVQFQMRHGNDLLTMDAIQDCDVNLKEQGQLIRQDEFTVFFRKKKCVRRLFLFEHLVLFSKPKGTNVGNDVYVYKQSLKTNDVGMTQNSCMGSLCFEIWIRRRKHEDTYTLKASSLEVKKAWTTDLERILWDQAAHSRELRLQERVFMGMGREPFMDIQPSDAAICDRAVGCVLPGRVPVACCSHRGLEYPRPRSIGSGSTTSTTLSQSSSSSGRGSLPPAGYPGNPMYGFDPNPALCSVTDNDLNNHHLRQHHLRPHCDQWKTHCPLMNSSESSEERTNLSAFSGDVVDDSSVGAHSSELKPPLCRTTSLRKNDSPTVTRKKSGVPPKPPHLEKTQSQLIAAVLQKVDRFIQQQCLLFANGKSTEV